MAANVEALVVVRGVKLATGASARLRTIDLPLEAHSRTISHSPCWQAVALELKPLEAGRTVLPWRRVSPAWPTCSRPILPAGPKPAALNIVVSNIGPVAASPPVVASASIHPIEASTPTGARFAVETAYRIPETAPIQKNFLRLQVEANPGNFKLYREADACQFETETKSSIELSPAPARAALAKSVLRLMIAARDAIRSEPVWREPKPHAASSYVLPALASLFRYARPTQARAARPGPVGPVQPRNCRTTLAAFRELQMRSQPIRVPATSGLRIVETFEYLKPMEEPPFDLWSYLTQLWRTAPVYVRYAVIPICLIMLVWAASPASGPVEYLASRWSRFQQGIEERAAIELSEDFRSGMEEWIGEGNWAESWRISRTGYVRPGKLAIYRPSMHMREYDVEFLMQIEKQAIGFAYRAQDTQNYYAAKITIVKPGPLPELSLVRYPVIGGRAGPQVQIPIRLLVHQDTPYRVRLTVSGQGFSTSIEGQLVDFWTDDRLKTGGFGFFSDTGESARIYWMKLSHQNDFIGRVCAYFRPADIDRNRKRPQ